MIWVVREEGFGFEFGFGFGFGFVKRLA